MIPVACEAADRADLLRVERGEPPTQHALTCARCRDVSRKYDTLRSAIVATGPDEAAPPRWEAQVWAELDHRAGRARPRRGLWVPLAALAAVVAVGVAVWPTGDASTRELALELTVERSGSETARRGEHAQRGDSLTIRATVGDRPAVVIVYHEGRAIVAHCGEDVACPRARGVVTLSVSLDYSGRYHVVLLTAPDPLPAPRGILDSDVASARERGATDVIEQLVVH